MKDLLQDRNT